MMVGCQEFSVVRADDDIVMSALANVEIVTISVIALRMFAAASADCCCLGREGHSK